MPHARGGTLAIMGFAGNTREQKVIASPNGCAKECRALILHTDLLFLATMEVWKFRPLTRLYAGGPEAPSYWADLDCASLWNYQV
jgi:hypothetical protein